MFNIAVIACADTKMEEMFFAAEKISKLGYNPVTIDISTGHNIPMRCSISRDEVLSEGGFTWENVAKMSKSDAIASMTKSLKCLVKRLYCEDKVHSYLGMGGLQNTVMCSAAFNELPLGVPKMIISTIASGNRNFETVVGDKDIMVMPSIVDFTGINSISNTIINNSVVALVGMTENGINKIEPSDKLTIGTTLMGITNETVMNATKGMKKKGYEVLSFHSTGVGGRTMEYLIRQGLIDAVMDLTLHEMTAEYFGGLGYSRGSNNRLVAAAETGIPALICPGGIDFICLRKNELFKDQEQRGFVWHNPELTHTKLYDHEVLDITKTIIERLNRSKGKVTVLLPMYGLRSLSSPGEAFYNPNLIKKMKVMFERDLSPNIRFVTAEYNFNDPEFAKIVISEMELLLEQESNIFGYNR